MITLSCSQCRTIIEMDDAFAGGVCRCRHCGAIQTVPKSDETSANSTKTIYTKPPGGEGLSSSGLDELADVVAGSGVTSSRLQNEIPPSPLGLSRKTLWSIIAAAISVVILFAIGSLMFRSATPLQKQSADGSIQPAFCGVKLNAKSVAYVLDRGSATGELFGNLKQAAIRSARSLGEASKFQILFWDNGSVFAFPGGGPIFATDSNLDSASRALDSVTAQGQSDAIPAVRRALASDPELIVLATAKGAQLDQQFAENILRERGDKKIRFETFDLGESQVSRSLQTIAQSSGAASHLIDAATLRQSAKE